MKSILTIFCDIFSEVFKAICSQKYQIYLKQFQLCFDSKTSHVTIIWFHKQDLYTNFKWFYLLITWRVEKKALTISKVTWCNIRHDVYPSWEIAPSFSMLFLWKRHVSKKTLTEFIQYIFILLVYISKKGRR